MRKLDVGRKTYEAACLKAIQAGRLPAKTWDELSDDERLDWMDRVLSLAFTGPVFA